MATLPLFFNTNRATPYVPTSWDEGIGGHETFGYRGLLMLPGGTIESEYEGTKTGNLSFEVGVERMGELPVITSSHPIEPNLWLRKRKVKMGESFAIAHCEYVGVESPNGNQSEETYSLSVGVGQEAIQAHPDFKELAGSPEAPANGARWVDFETGAETRDNARGIFKEFKLYLDAEGNELNEFAGIKNYLAINNVIWRKHYTTTDIPADWNNVDSGIGKKATPEGPVPNVAGDFDWLLLGPSIERKLTFPSTGGREGVFTVTKEWMMSGPRGWNPFIYGV